MYISTRSDVPPVGAARAILDGMAPDGGLYVPREIPALPAELLGPGRLSYAELSLRVLSPFFPEFGAAKLAAAVEASAAAFDAPEVAPLVRRGRYHFLELFHGPTLAFKDLALTLMGALMRLAQESSGDRDEIVILVATSGDTGKAALAGFSDMPRVRIVVFYPDRGVSAVQRLQMVTHEAGNAAVIGLEGSFDDAQRGVKALFADAELAADLKRRGMRLSSANSINIARLLPQIVYYVKAWRDLAASGELGPGGEMDVAVPTGNFGDILAARYAKAMGLPIRRFVCASNRNHVLTDFFETGRYDRRRQFYTTQSPSMDILVSSNLERLVFDATGGDPARTSGLMRELAENGYFSLSETERSAVADFRAGWADEAQAAAAIRSTFAETGYLIDPHTAVAVAVMDRLGGPDGNVPVVLAATASPFKFPATVAAALCLEAFAGAPGRRTSATFSVGRAVPEAGVSGAVAGGALPMSGAVEPGAVSSAAALAAVGEAAKAAPGDEVAAAAVAADEAAADEAAADEAAALAELDLAEFLAARARLELPEAVRSLRGKPRRHHLVLEPGRMKSALLDILDAR